MARNSGDGHRVGTIKNRTQTYNPNTGKYVKRDTETGQFVSSKDTPYKSIRCEESALSQKNKKS